MSHELLTDVQHHEDYREAQFFSPLFQRNVSVHLMDTETPLEYAAVCAAAFNALNSAQLRQLYRYSRDYCLDFCEYVGETPPEINQPEDILPLIQPLALSIPSISAEEAVQTAPVIHLELDCDWEPEHGLEWLIRDGQILYVGSCEMLQEWQPESYYADYALNYVFGNTYDDL
ncbi:DUF6985 domain-containing protein [Paenibacillus wulumuqiensis]|uniref:DUF6985 domain-containing protein n=1 Tax=Paenibacillus wulumuqiensis TaxID=1567107 RepID=UPI000696277B|nr:hypothetical protein [Paenibacillus wulumuqiensis]